MTGRVALVQAGGREALAVQGHGTFSNQWYTDGPFRGSLLTARDEHVIRPLAVVDPESRRDVEAFRDLYVTALRELRADYTEVTPGLVANALQLAFRRWAEPALPEPGLWAVVEAAYIHAPDEREEWVRGRNGWRSLRNVTLAAWSELASPVLVREGVGS